MYEPIPGLSTLKAFSPAPKSILKIAEPELVPFDIRHASSALITVALSCAFGLRPPSVLRPTLYSEQVRRHIAARLRQGEGMRGKDLCINSFHFHPQPNVESEPYSMFDVFGCVTVGEKNCAYMVKLRKSADTTFRMLSLRII
ncbi:hypothetical protein CMUST_03895 [Corynebacterium mustelae]|uniref:Uncharacterized protein n=1 Tax=Corynebacterium mustelae TaxID=571915 RepID=A0A0G3H001_9CORY|nr:hypothetical protein [Corynebacterium mustelae]AKK05123.1 hypothetical protein CMUST_03895 [Corynebacterium mustelae]